MPPTERMRYYPAVGPAIPRGKAGRSRVTHPFAGRGLPHALDLHVLSTPPAFVLSQDQTLQENLKAPRTRSSRNAVSIGPRPESIDRDLISRCSTRKPQLDESHRTNVTLDCQTATCAPSLRGNAKNNHQRSACKGQILQLHTHFPEQSRSLTRTQAQPSPRNGELSVAHHRTALSLLATRMTRTRTVFIIGVILII